MAGFPCPRKQLVDFVDLVLGDAAEEVGEPGLGVNVVELGGFDQGVGDGGGLAAALRADEEPVFAAQRQQPFILPMSGRKSSFITAGILSKVADFASSIARTGRRVGSSTSRWHPAS